MEADEDIPTVVTRFHAYCMQANLVELRKLFGERDNHLVMIDIHAANRVGKCAYCTYDANHAR